MMLERPRRWAMLLLAWLAFCAPAVPAAAQPAADLAPALARIAADSYGDTEAALGMLSLSGGPQAAASGTA